MKFALNGALTIGTLDGANLEIRDAVGPDNIFIFGLNAAEVQEKLSSGYNPADSCDTNAELQRVIDAINDGVFSKGDQNRFSAMIDSLIYHGDPYLVLADFRSYMECQETVDACWRDHEQWIRKSIINVAAMGYFSSDRTIREYARDIWKVVPISWSDTGSK